MELTGSLMAFCSAAMPPVWICSNMGFSSGSSCRPKSRPFVAAQHGTPDNQRCGSAQMPVKQGAYPVAWAERMLLQ